MPGASWVSAWPSPGQGAGAAYLSSTSAADVSPAPQFMSQTYGPWYEGMKWEFDAFGIVSNTSTPTLNLGFYYGGVAGVPLLTSGAIATTSGLSSYWWRIHGFVEVLEAGSSGSVECMGWLDLPTSATAVARTQMSSTGQPVTVNTTVNSALTAGATWGTNSASNTLTCKGAIFRQLN